MGFNTACIILNDALYSLAQREGVGRQIELGVLTAEEPGSLYERRAHYVSGFQALPSQPADTVQVVAVGGNRIFRLGHGHWRDEPEDLLRKVADQMGFRLVRKSTKAKP